MRSVLCAFHGNGEDIVKPGILSIWAEVTHGPARHTFDTAFAEDDRPWITGEARGTLAVLVLRRIAYTLLTLFRSVTQRSDGRRHTRWRVLLSWVRGTLVGVTEDEVAGLRRRGCSPSQAEKPGSRPAGVAT